MRSLAVIGADHGFCVQSSQMSCAISEVNAFLRIAGKGFESSFGGLTGALRFWQGTTSKE